MEGRKPRGIYVLVEDVAAGADAEALSRWYVETRIPEATRSGVFRDATRYERAGARGGKREPRFFTVFETDAADPSAAWSALALGPDHPARVPIMAAGFVVTGALPPAPTGRRTLGLLVGATDCPDPSRRAEFDRWYDQVHAADVLRFGRHHAACRFERTGGDMPGFLALYETEGREPETLASYQAWPDRDPTMSEAAAVRHVWTFNLLHSQARR